MATQSAAGGGNGFFSNILSTVDTGLTSLAGTASKILPVWSSYQQAQQSTNQTAQPTVNQSKLPPNLNNIGGSVGAAVQASPWGSAMLVGGGILAVVLIIKLVKG